MEKYSSDLEKGEVLLAGFWKGLSPDERIDLYKFLDRKLNGSVAVARTQEELEKVKQDDGADWIVANVAANIRNVLIAEPSLSIQDIKSKF